MGERWTPRAVVVGSGLAGLTVARELAGAGWRIEVLTPGRAGRDGATHRVHALAPWILLTAPWVRGDSPARFLADLKRHGHGMERPGLAEVLAAEANPAAHALVAELDLVPLTDDPAPLGGHALPRGMRFLPRNKHLLLAPLLRRCAAAGVRIRERTLAAGLIVAEGRVTGVVALRRDDEAVEELHADAVVLASGGSGAVFPVSTAPHWCRGSGLAFATSAGVLLHHPENIQALPVTATPPLFFPTSAALLAGRILIGGRELSEHGDLEATTRKIAEAVGRGMPVVLDPVDGGASMLPERVREGAAFRSAGKIALTVAAHHSVGGIAIDTCGRTSMAGLYACGEAAGGVQGQRRTMGTGLLEAAIFGTRAARAVERDSRRRGPARVGGEARLSGLPSDPAALERRLDVLMRPLTAMRPASAVETARRELEAWPDQRTAALGQAGVLAALRRQAALAVLAPPDRLSNGVLPSTALGSPRTEEEAWSTTELT